jgi:hypothetical protein
VRVRKTERYNIEGIAALRGLWLIKCGGRPEHNLHPIDTHANSRLPPATFMREFKSNFPCACQCSASHQSCLTISWPVRASLYPKSDGGGGVLLSSVRQSSNFNLWNRSVRRCGQSPAASLELLLHPKQPEWRLYAKPEESEAVNSDIRHLLESPIARLTCASSGLLKGSWDCHSCLEQIEQENDRY